MCAMLYYSLKNYVKSDTCTLVRYSKSRKNLVIISDKLVVSAEDANC